MITTESCMGVRENGIVSHAEFQSGSLVMLFQYSA
jgi:hypothetical protein